MLWFLKKIPPDKIFPRSYMDFEQKYQKDPGMNRVNIMSTSYHHIVISLSALDGLVSAALFEHEKIIWFCPIFFSFDWHQCGVNIRREERQEDKKIGKVWKLGSKSKTSATAHALTTHYSGGLAHQRLLLSLADLQGGRPSPPWESTFGGQRYRWRRSSPPS